MKKTLLLPLIFLVVFVMIVGSACALTGGSKETQEPEVIYVTATTPAQVATLPPVATEPPVVVTEPPVVVTEPPVVATEPPVVVTEPPTNEPPDYFVEEFENGLGNYFYFVPYGNEDYADVRAEDGLLKFNITSKDLYYYLMYDPYTYGDVRLDVEVVNQGVNDNEVSLICRYDETLGWYEFSVTSGGLWTIYYYDNVINKDYSIIADGGSTNVKMGRDTNSYTVICQGRELSLYINGTLTKKVEHKDLSRGLVGIGVSSFDATPVIMNVPWMEISSP